MTTGAPLYLVTACTTPQEFVAAFRRYTDRTGLFVPSAAPLPAGKRGRIAIALRDGGVMIEGEAEVVASTSKPSALYGRTGMTIRFVEPDEASKTLLGELDRARIALKPVAPTVAPRASEIAAEPRPVVPSPGGRIDAANALAETVTIGDVDGLRDVPITGKPTTIPPPLGEPRARNTSSPPPIAPVPPLKASQRFVMPAIPTKAPTLPPPVGAPRPLAVPKIDPAKLEPVRPLPIALAPPPAPIGEPEPEPAMIVSKPPVGDPEPAPEPVLSRTSTIRSPAPPPKSAHATQPTAVVPPPPRAPTVPPARAKPVFVPEPPDEATDLTDVPAIARDAPSDAHDGVPRLAPSETRKTSLGISAVLVMPAPATPPAAPEPEPDGPREAVGDVHDTELMTAEPEGLVPPAHAPGLVEVDQLSAAAASELSGDWTMTPDADAPVPLVVPAAIAPPGPLTGDWIISTDADAVDGWSAPSKVQKRQLTNTGVGPPMLEVASDVPLSSEPRREPAREDTGPKVQIDPTLIEALPDVDRLAASSADALAIAPPMPMPVHALPTNGLAPMPAMMQVPTIPGVEPARAPTPPPAGWVQPMLAPPPHLPTPLPGAMIAMPAMPAASMPAMPTPLPGFAPPVPGRSADPTQLVRPGTEELSIGDTTGMVPSRRRRIIAAVAFIALAIAGGVYLVMTTGGSGHRGAPPTPGSGSALAIAPAPTPTPDASVAATAPGPTDATAAPAVAPIDAAEVAVADAAPPPADATGCKVKVISFPGGAEVVVDGAVVGHTPSVIDVPCGVETKLAFRKAGLIGQTRSVTPKAGVEGIVRVGLPKPTFSLKVSSTPAGAAITINGKASGVTPSTVKLNAFEAATVVLTKAGFDSYSEKITPKTNAETVHGTLKRKPR